MNRKRFTVLLCVVLLLCCVCQSSLAYIAVKTEKLVNVMEPVTVDVLLEEVFVPEDAQELTVGEEIAKKPRLQNTGVLNEYLAMKVLYVSGGSASGTELRTNWISLLNVDSTNWELAVAQNDYAIYYYKSAVAPNDYTTYLFDGVRVSSEWTNSCDFDIVLTGAAIQAEGVTMNGTIAAGLFE